MIDFETGQEIEAEKAEIANLENPGGIAKSYKKGENKWQK